VAWAASIHVVELFAHLLREEEHRDAAVEVYARISAGIEAFQTHVEMEQRRLHPNIRKEE
jgi:hypothetical protein